MSDTVVTAIAVNTWVKVATATTICTLSSRKPGFKYYQTTVDTGGSAPTAPGGLVPGIAEQLFKKCDPELVITSASSDVYVCCFVDDSNIGTGAGSVRVSA